MNWVVHVISTIDVHHVNVVRVAPADWPGIDEPKRVTSILEAPMLVVSSAYVKSVLGPKTSGVMSVGNASVRVIASTCRPRLRRPRLGPSRVVLLRVSHGVLLRLAARLSLLLRGMLFSRLGLLGVFRLRLRFVLCGLGSLLVLGGLSFRSCGLSLLVMLFLPLFLSRVNGRRCSENQQQRCCRNC